MIDRHRAASEIRIVGQSPRDLANYAQVPISFEVRERFEVELVDGGLGGIRLRLCAVDRPYVKDYDAIYGCRPDQWPRRWDLSRWWIAAAFAGEHRVGGAAIAFGSPDITMLEGRTDLAMLWDIRVHPAHRHGGIGTRLFCAAEEWARSHGCRQLKVETQSINVAACRFYARQGFALGVVDRFAYPDLPNEVQLLWYKVVGGNDGK